MAKCWYQRLDPSWSFEDLAALQLSLEQYFPAFVLRGAPVPIDTGRYLFYSNESEEFVNLTKVQNRLQAVVAQAVKLARCSDSVALQLFCQEVRPQFPQSMELFKLHYAVCGDLAAHREAILVCLDYLQQSPQAHEVYAMLNASLGKFNKRDCEILDAFAKLSTMEACESEIYYLVRSRNSVDGAKVFQRLQAQWGTETKVGYAQYADALYECELYEAAESACWNALERAPMDPCAYDV